jgi:hypothetical protein
MGANPANLWVCGAPRPEVTLMKNLRVNVDVRVDVAAILKWVVVVAAILLI